MNIYSIDSHRGGLRAFVTNVAGKPLQARYDFEFCDQDQTLAGMAG